MRSTRACCSLSHTWRLNTALCTHDMATRADGRVGRQIRPLSAEFSNLPAADGSVQLDCGDTSVCVAVYGPRPPRAVRMEQPHAALVEVTVLPPSGAASDAEFELQQALQSIYSTAIVTEAYPRTVISIIVQIMNNDGSLTSAAINGATLALVDAGIPLRGMVAAAEVAAPPLLHAAAGEVFMDPTRAEAAAASVRACHAVLSTMPDAPVYSNASGLCAATDAAALQAAALAACGTVGAFMRLAAQQKVSKDILEPRGAVAS